MLSPSSTRRQSRLKNTLAIAVTPVLERLEDRQLLSFSANIDFKPRSSPTPAGYLADSGAVYSKHGGGPAYGWKVSNNTAVARHSADSPDTRYDTFLSFRSRWFANNTWEIAVPNGDYRVHIVSGDPNRPWQYDYIKAEGQPIIDGSGSSDYPFVEATSTVTVKDGRLTLTTSRWAPGTTINFIDIHSYDAAPAAPANLAATANNADGSVGLSWDANDMAESIAIQRSSDNGTTWEDVDTVSGSDTSYTDTGVSAATTYIYRLVASNPVGDSAPADSAPVTTSDAPAAPANLVATASTTDLSVALTWDALDGVSTYNIQRSSDGGATWDDVDISDTNSYTDTSVAAGTAYVYQVTATNAWGDSAPSASANATTGSVPSKPADLLATVDTTARAINLAWQAADTATGYVIERSDDGGSTWSSLDTTDGSTLLYADTTADPNTEYTYRVSATNVFGQSDPSDTVVATLAVSPDVPQNVSAEVQPGGSSIVLSWDASAGADQYIIERSTDGTTFTQLDTLTSDTTNYSDDNLTAGTTYSYRISASNSAGTSAPSDVVSATITAGAPTAPTNVSARRMIWGRGVRITWDAVDSAGSYTIQRSTDGTTFTDLNTVDGSLTVFIDRQARSNTKYYYRVVASNDFGDSDPSASASVKKAGWGWFF